jgi:hypothetical protein
MRVRIAMECCDEHAVVNERQLANRTAGGNLNPVAATRPTEAHRQEPVAPAQAVGVASAHASNGSWQFSNESALNS